MQMVPMGDLAAVRPLERMNSPLENRKVRLRGLGGPALCGVRSTCASATRRSPNQIRMGMMRR
jgi:hypothetical protein